jgi:hypothetical protein
MAFKTLTTEDLTRDQPRPLKLSLEGLPKQYLLMGDSTPLKYIPPKYEFMDEKTKKLFDAFVLRSEL